MDRIKEKAAEVLQSHAYSGGYDVDEFYGKSKPAKSSHDEDESSHASAYSESPYTSVYNKPSKPAYEESSDSYGYGRKPAAEEESSHSYGYGRKPEESSESTYGYGKKPNKHGAYEDESEVKPSYYGGPGDGQQDGADYEGYSRPGHASRPAYGEESYSEGSRPDFGRTTHGYQGDDEPPKTHSHSRPEYGGRPSYGQEEFSSEPGYGKYGDPEENERRRPSRHNDYGYEGSGLTGGAGFGDEYERPRPGHRKHETDQSGYEEGRPAWQQDIGESRPAWQQDIGESRPAWQQDIGEGRPAWQQDVGEGRPAWQQDIGDSGYGGGRRPHGRRDDEYETGRTEGWTSGFGGPGHRFEEGEERKPSYYGEEGIDSEDRRSGGRGRHGRGHDETDYLAEQTGGLSLGGDSYSGFERPKRHDDDEEEDDHKRHGHHHHHKHDDDED